MTPLNLFKLQQNYFNSDVTKDVNFRLQQLKKLKTILKENESALFKAIQHDFSKSEFETYTTELSLIYHEINIFIRKIK